MVEEVINMLREPEETRRALVSWIKNYFEQNGVGCSAVIGISGGKDSSIAAALCVEALGTERVIGVMMPNGVQADIQDAKTLIDCLKIKSITVNIAEPVKALKKALEAECYFRELCQREHFSEDAALNLPARIRMSTLYAVAQNLPQGGRVVNTCNRSEDYIGYSTKFGDAAGDFSPLSDLLVEEVKQIGYLLELPKELIDKTPSDGLSGISDEDKFGFTYQILDKYIQTGICNDIKVREKIDRLHQQNLHKLLEMPRYQNIRRWSGVVYQ